MALLGYSDKSRYESRRLVHRFGYRNDGGYQLRTFCNTYSGCTLNPVGNTFPNFTVYRAKLGQHTAREGVCVWGGDDTRCSAALQGRRTSGGPLSTN